MFGSQEIGSGLVSLEMIFEALQSELLRFIFSLLSSKILKFPGFNLHGGSTYIIPSRLRDLMLKDSISRFK